ncbi:erythromycin esterase family protein [Kitasatospora sp. NBC_01266]|uniref:erythromycin esterase family protein n=1 Tax=Kitasatospora sp. NBC_01266 TaxID=2903572 RepID=UPI002E364DE9|nr:erythromycin esterase family protein [Kitasatospora sp. NBC_01266]
MPLPETVRLLPLTDPLGGFTELIGDARVVAIGENNHHIAEFTALRDRMLRLLVTEMDFGIIAVESGFAEGHLVDDWIHGGPGDVQAVGRDGFTFRFGESEEMHELLRWLRAHNAAGGRVRFAGLDIPGSGGSGLPALRRVREYLRTYHPNQLPFVDTAIEATAPYRSANNGVAPTRYAALSTETRDAASTALTRLLLRLDALRPGPHSDSHSDHLVARHHALGALRLDEQLRELLELRAPERPELLPSSRDVYQAETVHLLRELHGTDQRIVLLLHNAHAQRVPMQLIPGVLIPSAGSYLAAALGTGYLAVGITALAGRTTDVRMDEAAPQGFEVVSRPLPPPVPNSVEAAVEESVPGGGPVLLDLRPARGTAGPSAVRHAYTHVPVEVPAAFDLLACLPTMSPSSSVLPAPPAPATRG